MSNDIGSAIAAFGMGYLGAKKEKKEREREEKRYNDEFALALRRVQQSEVEFALRVQQMQREEEAAARDYGRKAYEQMVKYVTQDRMSGDIAIDTVSRMYPGFEPGVTAEDLDMMRADIEAADLYKIEQETIAREQAQLGVQRSAGVGPFAPDKPRSPFDDLPIDAKSAIAVEIGVGPYNAIASGNAPMTPEMESRINGAIQKAAKGSGRGGSGGSLATSENVARLTKFFGDRNVALDAVRKYESDDFASDAERQLVSRVINDATTNSENWRRFEAAYSLPGGNPDERARAAQEMYITGDASLPIYTEATNSMRGQDLEGEVKTTQAQLKALSEPWIMGTDMNGNPERDSDGRLSLRPEAPPNSVIEIRALEDSLRKKYMEWTNAAQRTRESVDLYNKEVNRRNIEDKAKAANPPSNPWSAMFGSLTKDAAESLSAIKNLPYNMLSPEAREAYDLSIQNRDKARQQVLGPLFGLAEKAQSNVIEPAAQITSDAFNYLSDPASKGWQGIFNAEFMDQSKKRQGGGNAFTPYFGGK